MEELVLFPPVRGFVLHISSDHFALPPRHQTWKNKFKKQNHHTINVVHQSEYELQGYMQNPKMDYRNYTP
jgi:hypothetical protein